MLKMTIGVGPGGELALSNEIRLVKAALLYADRAILLSPTAYMIHSISSGRHLNDSATLVSLVPMLAQLDPSLREKLEGLEGMVKLLSLSRAQRCALPKQMRQEIEKQTAGLKKSLGEVRNVFASIGKQAGLPALERALSSGIISLHSFETSHEMDDTIDQFTGALFKAVAQGETYPLFDEQVGGLVSSAIREGWVAASSSAVDRGKQVQLGCV
ncbi:MAG: hypothetical protein AB1941_26595 [Gemmatimonadota bacterium]